MNRRSFLKIALRTIGGTALAALGGAKYITVEPRWYKVKTIDLTLPKLPPAFKGFTITHLTDLHLNDWMTPEYFSEVVDKANDLESDVIVITGDFIDGNTPDWMFPGIVEQLGALKAEMGVYGTLGNHDHWRSYGLVRGLMAEGGVVDLSNRIHTFQRGDENLYLCGLDDYMEKKQDLRAVTDPLPVDACAILLMHEPDYADISAPTQRFSLQLSGHSHGGQIDPPFIDPPVLPLYARKYPRGLYQVGDMLLHTSTGIGVTEPRVRFNCRPEIVQLVLT